MQTYGKAKMVIVDSMPTPAMADIMAVLEVPVGQTMEQDSHWYTNSETIMQKNYSFIFNWNLTMLEIILQWSILTSCRN